MGISAWPWPHFLDDTLDGLLLPRQEQRQSSTSGGSTQTPTITSGSASTTGGGGVTITASVNPVTTARTTNGNNNNSNSAAQSNSTTVRASKSVLINPQDPPGGIQMVTPAPISGMQYYKIGDFVTFKWNYTSLSVTPTAVDVLASCALNAATYTISSNMSVEETGAITWDTGNMQATATNPLPVASYTLIIHDSSKDMTDIPSAGYLGAFAQHTFGVYTKQAYVPLNEFRCATCSGALSLHEKQALGVLIGTSIITVLSFSVFANGFGGFS